MSSTELSRIEYVLSRGAFHTLHPLDVLMALNRHYTRDWGDVSDEDRQANDRALAHGGRLLSVYHDQKGVKFWIITEADRSLTTVLLPEDY